MTASFRLDSPGSPKSPSLSPWGRALGAAAGFAAGAAAGWLSSSAWMNGVQARTRRRWWQHFHEAELAFFPDGSIGPVSGWGGEVRPLRVNVLGDSAAAGVGASSADRGYVGIVLRRLAADAGVPVVVCNVAQPGDSSWLLMEQQLPELKAGRMFAHADVTMCVIGGNDIADRTFTAEGFAWTAERLYPALPGGTVVSTVPSFGLSFYERKCRAANELIRRLAAENDLELAELHAATASLWSRSTLGIPRQFFTMESDVFHPNDHGYTVWAEAVWPAVRRAWLRDYLP
ncbi:MULTISPECIES: GDSL-type esterase/lipase family protein [unclassified Brevibacterium]|uniref:SGNH/GDSL hydrolase family protein n=1 Tax=unclassified Brevibacterium TaxID=2614124 RepID=UPI0008A64F8F|nr:MULTISPECIES: GDSL-type esterase/lipase family protein [unclassified Brevibacterium]OFL66580.1 hypothetical protein HMPREF2757_02460 [Brevibacterium sp. HMSC063G07]OFS24815.1 hypothetical protein HMPREF3162_10490 [Brevibacterium sp. HMSC07C04]